MGSPPEVFATREVTAAATATKGTTEPRENAALTSRANNYASIEKSIVGQSLTQPTASEVIPAMPAVLYTTAQLRGARPGAQAASTQIRAEKFLTPSARLTGSRLLVCTVWEQSHKYIIQLHVQGAHASGFPEVPDCMKLLCTSSQQTQPGTA